MPVEDLHGHRVDGEISQGGMGRVYVARDLALGREVAVRGLHWDWYWDDDDEARERLRREARLFGASPSPKYRPGVRPAGGGSRAVDSDGVRSGNEPYALRPVETGTGRLPGLPTGISPRLCAPESHRSPGPEAQQRPHLRERHEQALTDFGVARFLAREAAAGSGTIVYGTPAYLVPERRHGDAAKVDGRADVYSLAVMNYELLLGRLPFEADPDDPRRTMQAHAQEPVPRPRDLNPDFPQAIERVLLLGLTKDPRARPRARSFGSQMERPRTGCGRGGRVRDWRATRPGRRSRRRSKSADTTADYRTVSMARGGVRADQSEPALRTRLVADDRMMASAASPSSFLTRRLTELRLPVYRPHRSHGLWGAATALIAVDAFVHRSLAAPGAAPWTAAARRYRHFGGG